MVSDAPISPKMAATIALTFISMLIVIPMYYSLSDQRILLSRIEYTRESDGFSIQRLRAQADHENLTDALLDTTTTSKPTISFTSNSTRLLLREFGPMNKVHLRKQNPSLSKEMEKLKADKSDRIVV